MVFLPYGYVCTKMRMVKSKKLTHFLCWKIKKGEGTLLYYEQRYEDKFVYDLETIPYYAGLQYYKYTCRYLAYDNIRKVQEYRGCM